MDKSPIPIGHFADIGQGQQIHYHAAGPADGEVVIFLHGAGGGASGYSNFKGNFAEFAAAGYRAILPDMLGFGLSSKPDVPMYDLDFFVDDGVWTTPVVVGDVTLWTTKPGYIYALDRYTGEFLWKQKIGGPALSSPVLVDGVLVQASGKGVIYGFDFSSPRTQPTELWSVQLEGNIESTPVVWNGRIYVGTRAGFVYCIGLPS